MALVSFFVIKPVSLRAHRPLLKRATDASLEPMASTSIAFRPVVVACTARLDQSRAVAPRPARIITRGVPKATLIGTLASVALLAAHPPMAFAEDTELAGVAKAVTATPLECASDPSCAAERSNLLAAGAYAPPIDVVEDEDEAVRRAICPRNPTADVCRSKKDRMKVNDSKCKIPIGLGCAMWK